MDILDIAERPFRHFVCGGSCENWCFCGGGGGVVVFLWWCGWKLVFLWWWCCGVFVVVCVVFLWWCLSGDVLWWWWCGWCFCGGVVMFLRWCFCGGVLVVVFLWWCGGVFVVVVVWWCFCGSVVVFLWWCFCGWGGVCVFFCGCVFVVVFLRWCFCGGVLGGGVAFVFSRPVRWGLLDFMSVSSPSPSCPPPPPRRPPPRRISTTILWVQCGMPDLNRDPVSSVDPNRELVSSVWRAGPQRRSCEFSVACRTPTAILSSVWREREDWSDSLAVSTFAWHAAHCLQCARLDFGFASCWWLGGWWLVARHICYADACWKISFYWAWLPKWKIFYAEGPLLIFENWLTSWKPKVLPRWSACRTGLCMTQCKLPDIILCIWIQPLVGGAICWNKRWLNALEVYWHVWCRLFILLICWQVVSWHDLACLVQRMLLVTHCNAFVIWACAFAATIAFDFASGGMLPCLMPVSLFIFDRWYPDMIWHVCCGMFWHVCFCQVVYWHVLANGCDLFTWTLLIGAILSSTQDTTRSCKNPEKKDAGLAAFEMHLLRSVWSLPANLLYFVRRLSASGPWNKTRWQP